mgnify:CR=1 FL=1
MPSKVELESHPIANLKKEISKTNIKGYSKMKKPEVVELMLKNKDRFHHIKKYVKPTSEPKPKPKPKPVEKPKPKPVEKPKPVKKIVIKVPKQKEEKPLLNLSKLKINNDILRYNNNNVEIIASLLDDEFYLDVFSSQGNKSKPRAPRGEANMVLCEIVKHLLKNESKYGLNKKSKFRLQAGELEDVENFNQQKLNKYYMTLGFKKDIKESTATDKTIFTQPISGFLNNCMKFDKDVIAGKKPKPKIPDIDSIENSLIDEIEKPIKKNKYDDAIDIYDLLGLGDFKRPQRERAFKIIQKIIKTTGTESRFPEVDVKKRLKL